MCFVLVNGARHGVGPMLRLGRREHGGKRYRAGVSKAESQPPHQGPWCSKTNVCILVWLEPGPRTPGGQKAVSVGPMDSVGLEAASLLVGETVSPPARCLA